MRTECEWCGFYHFDENDYLADRDGPPPSAWWHNDSRVELSDEVLVLFLQKLHKRGFDAF